jgi:hypothetical protein
MESELKIQNFSITREKLRNFSKLAGRRGIFLDLSFVTFSRGDYTPPTPLENTDLHIILL